METTQRGSAIWSYTLRSAGAILLQSVPATIMTSDWRGLGRNTMPKRSRSYRAAPACIISTAQHARPNVIGHSEPVRVQLISLSAVVVTKPLSERFSGAPMSETLLLFAIYAVQPVSLRHADSAGRIPARSAGPLLPASPRRLQTVVARINRFASATYADS